MKMKRTNNRILHGAICLFMSLSLQATLPVVSNVTASQREGTKLVDINYDVADTDSDNMPDWWEARYGLQVSTPDADGNPDGDANDNLTEYNAGTEPTVFDYLYLVDTEGNVFLLDTGGKFSDLDADGIPNWWERRYAGNNEAMAAHLDSDGDGHTNLQEFETGTDPGDADSVFAIENYRTRLSPDGAEMIFTFDTQVDRIYKVFASDRVGEWPVDPARQISGDGNPVVVTVPVVGQQAFFVRIQAVLVRP